MALPRKKKGGDFALLLDEPEESGPPEAAPEDDDFEDDLSELDPAAGDEGDEMAEGDEFGDETAPDVDPEHARLAKQLGFTEPDQQQALVDLIKLVAAPDQDAAAEASSDLPPLPESLY